MKAKFLFSLVLVASSFALSFQSENNVSSTLTVTVTDIKNSSGEIDLNLFNKAEGFADDATKAYKHLRGNISNGKCSVTFQNLPFGQYAIIIYHDANSNNKCDETWYGMPI